MTEGEVLQFHCRPTAEPVDKPREDRSHEHRHACDIVSVSPKTPDFSARLEYLVATTMRSSRCPGSSPISATATSPSCGSGRCAASTKPSKRRFENRRM